MKISWSRANLYREKIVSHEFLSQAWEKVDRYKRSKIEASQRRCLLRNVISACHGPLYPSRWIRFGVRGSESRELSMYSKRYILSLSLSFSIFPPLAIMFLRYTAVERNDLKSWMKASIKFASDRHLRRNRNVWPTVANERPKEKCYRKSFRPRNNFHPILPFKFFFNN